MENHLRQHCVPALQGGAFSAFLHPPVDFSYPCLSDPAASKWPRSIALLSSASHSFSLGLSFSLSLALSCSLRLGLLCLYHVPESIFETRKLNLPACLGSCSFKPHWGEALCLNIFLSPSRWATAAPMPGCIQLPTPEWRWTWTESWWHHRGGRRGRW